MSEIKVSMVRVNMYIYDVAVPAYFTTLTHIKQIQLKLFYLIIYYFLTLKFHGKVIGAY